MAKKDGKKMMWDGRFDCGMAQSMIDLSFSLSFRAMMPPVNPRTMEKGPVMRREE